MLLVDICAEVANVHTAMGSDPSQNGTIANVISAPLPRDAFNNW